jgi:hydrogenase/urease accessory protein HupE
MLPLRQLIRQISIFAILLSPVLAFAHGISEEQKQRMLSGGYIQYIVLGAEHMLTGYDHLLFLFGVVFFLTTLRDVAKFVTVFTAGHCITLIFATFYQITWNYYLVDAIIAISVMYKGFDNNDGFAKYLSIKAPNMLTMVFVFGLIHGFGLSTRLQQLPLGDDSTGILFRILSFNVGVEVGQIAALSLMVTLLATWRKQASFTRFSFGANSLLIFAGVYLLFMQMHGFWHGSAPDSFTFPVAEHTHIHEDMAIEQERKESGRESLD